MDRSDLNIHWKVVGVGKTGTGERSSWKVKSRQHAERCLSIAFN